MHLFPCGVTLVSVEVGADPLTWNQCLSRNDTWSSGVFCSGVFLKWLCLKFWVPSIGKDIHFTPQVSVPMWGRLDEIRNPQQQHAHTHTLSPRDVSQLSYWGRLLASCDCRQISQEQRCRLQRPHLQLPSHSFPFSLPNVSEVEAKASPPHPHISLPPALSSGVRGVEVIDVLRWEWRCRAWIIISPGTEQRSQRTHQSRNRSWQGQMMKSSPSNDPHPRWGGRKRQGRKGLKEETFSEAVCLLYVATKLSFSSRGAFGYSVIRTYSRRASAVVSVKRTEVEKNFTRPAYPLLSFSFTQFIIQEQNATDSFSVLTASTQLYITMYQAP